MDLRRNHRILDGVTVSVEARYLLDRDRTGPHAMPLPGHRASAAPTWREEER